jgi:hypothetical protein
MYVWLRGVEKAKSDINSLIDNSTPPVLYYDFGLSENEAVDFIKRLSAFHQTMTLTGYSIDNIGWLTITYDISGIKWTDMKVAKRAICLELHSYILENHGIDSRALYIPTLTDTLMEIKIAISPLAVKDYKNRFFVNNKKNGARQMVEK